MKTRKQSCKPLLITAAAFILAAVVSVAVYKITENFPVWITENYSHKAFNIITMPLKQLTGLFSFSVAELILIMLVFYAVAALILSIILVIVRLVKRKGRPFMPLIRFICIILILACIALSAFIWQGGLNYNGLTLAEQLKYPDDNYSAAQLYEMTAHFLTQAGSIREGLNEAEDGSLLYPGDFSQMCDAALSAYESLPEKFSDVLADGYFTKAKPAAGSIIMCYTNITGIYPYILPEPIINDMTPDSSKLSTVCHEMAHQRSVAREDEANFIAVEACIYSEDPYFQYSGYFLAILHCLNSLYSVNRPMWEDAWKIMPDAVRRDINSSNLFWQQFETPVAEVSEKVNDVYLQANNIKDGVDSYGRLVDLLLADYYS